MYDLLNLFCLNFYKEFPDWTFNAVWGQEATPKICLSDFPVIPIDLGEFLLSWGPFNILHFLYLPGCDLPYSPGKAVGIVVSKVLTLGCFYKLYWLHKVNLKFLKAVWSHLNLYACLSNMAYNMVICPLSSCVLLWEEQILIELT